MARGDTVVLVKRQAGDQFKVRFPEDLHARLRAAAAASHRSVNAEVIDRLEASFSDGSLSLDGQIAALIARHVDAEVQHRLKAIASQIGGAP